MEPCVEPYGLSGIATHVMQLNDIVYDSQCRLRNDRDGPHNMNLFGDVNLVNGVRWPILATKPRWTRFRIVNASPSRLYKLQLVNEAGVNVGATVCKLVGSDGGFLKPPANFPAAGLTVGGAYRWDVVCDLTSFAGQNLYFYNVYDANFLVRNPLFTVLFP